MFSFLFLLLCSEIIRTVSSASDVTVSSFFVVGDNDYDCNYDYGSTRAKKRLKALEDRNLEEILSVGFFLFFFLFQCFFAHCGKFGSPYLGKAQQPQEQRYPFLSVCAVFSCVQTMVWPVASVNVRTGIDWET